MGTKTEIVKSTDTAQWDDYVYAHPQANLYHLAGWKKIIEKTYGHRTYYLIAYKDSKQLVTNNHQQSISNPKNSINPTNPINHTNQIAGILPLVHLKHFLFGNSLISIPFFDIGGILANDTETEQALLYEAIELARKLKVDNIELRHINPITSLSQSPVSNDQMQGSSLFRRSRIEFSQLFPEAERLKRSNQSSKSCRKAKNYFTIVTKSHKVRMMLELPESSDVLMKSFKAKLRSQIKKPIKEGLYAKIGGPELLKDFYQVFSINMRDLGSPVHSKKIIQNVLEEFSDQARIVLIYKDKQPVACSLIVGFKDTLENPWASALREYGRLSPNMLLYWTMLEYACDNRYAYFDFGRSSPDEGTYKFKEQWGAKPVPFHWHYIYLKGEPPGLENSEKSKFEKAIQYWQKLPVPVTKVIGPRIRKYIGL